MKNHSNVKALLENTESLITKAKKELAKHGIKSYATLVIKGAKFDRLDFGPFGKGMHFTSVVLGLQKNPRQVKNLKLIAEKLGWKLDLKELNALKNERQKSYKILKSTTRPIKNVDLSIVKAAFAQKGIIDYKTLTEFGVKKFNKLNFGDLGYARSFAGKILQRVLRWVDLKTLKEISRKLRWSTQSELERDLSKKEKVSQIRAFLGQYGITDRWTLFHKYSTGSFRKVVKSRSTDSNFSSCKFFSFRSLRSLKRKEKLASYLGWGLPTQEEKNEQYRLALKKNGLVTYFDLMRITWRDFIKMDFGDYGRGISFLRIALGYKAILIRGYNHGRGKKWVKGLEKLKEELAIQLKMK